MTNAERIRAMTDEEMACWIHRHDEMCWRDGHLSFSAILDFLRKEVSDNEL